MVTPEHHGALVDHLVQGSHPVRRIWPVRVRLTLFLVYLLLDGALLLWIWGRPDLAAKVHEPSFTLGFVALLLATVFTALQAFRSAVPGRTPSRIDGALALALVVVAALYISDAPTVGHSPMTGWLCGMRTLVIALVPWSILMIAIRRGAPVRVTSAATYAGAAALLFATSVLRLACPDDGSVHWLTWHVGTVAVATLLVTPFATTWLQRWRHA
jgi:hypothetical protein